MDKPFVTLNAAEAKVFVHPYRIMSIRICSDTAERCIYQLTLISQWLGHANLETSLIYAHADTGQERQAIEKSMDRKVAGGIEVSKYTVDDEEVPGSRMEQNYVFPYVTSPSFQVKVLSPTVEWELEVLVIMAKLESIMCDDNLSAPEYLISIKTVEIWYLLIKHISSEVTKQPQQCFIKQQRIHEMLGYIHQHYSENYQRYC